jgi:peptidoglycan/xylan/chitin deacetylase (PgdA/CDA1 family)
MFALAQYLTRHRLRILCYHGFSLGDEHEVAPHVFMQRQTFARRLRILKKRGLPVIPLQEAVQRLKDGRISKAETVLTFDDGWASNLTVGAPLLQSFGYPAAIYVTTEHLVAGTEVFNVLLFYMLCRSKVRSFALTGLHPEIDGSYQIGANPDKLRVQISLAAQRAYPKLVDRQQLLVPIANALGMDIRGLLSNERFQLLRATEIAELDRRGLDIQLHTHTHYLPADSFEHMSAEIEDNRRALRELLGKTPRHFCYPSGEYEPQHLDWLRRLGIESATTCEPGLNDKNTDLLQLKRYLDSDTASDIMFEAEVSGARYLIQRLLGGFSNKSHREGVHAA